MAWIDLIPVTKTRQKIWEYINALIGNTEFNRTQPAGAILSFASDEVPNGYLECDGSEVSRTSYSDLFEVIGTQWGIGDGSTTFNLPDFRGKFLRGFDNGAGIDSGRTFANSQEDATAINGLTQSRLDYVHQDYTSEDTASTSVPKVGYSQYIRNYTTTADRKRFRNAEDSLVSGDNETRPINETVLYCIKY